MHLLKTLSRTQKAALMIRPSSAIVSQAQLFSTRAAPQGNETSLTDAADILKINYIVEYDQGLNDE